MKVLIFDTFISGHHLEYIHHLYSYIDDSNEYIFSVPNEFNKVKNKFNWVDKHNVSFNFIDIPSIEKAHNSGHLLKSLRLSKLLSKYVDKHNPDRVFLISLIDYFPFLPFFLRKCKTSGIIYKIYLYEWQKYSIIQKLYESARIAAISYFVQSAFVLNDESASVYLNKLWKTKCFKYLIDPYVPIDKSQLYDIRNELGVPMDAKLFCHSGSMAERKGTIEILKAMKLIEEDSCIYVVFAGKISPEIHEQFYDIYNKLKHKERVIVIDDFCSYTFLGSLIFSSDCLLLPYKRTSLSSGFIYYALQFGKNVIGGTDGLIGKLIKRYKLGNTIKQITPEDIAKAIATFSKTIVPQIDLNLICPSKFVKQILEGIL